MPEMPTGFWSQEKIQLMFYYAKWFLAEHQAFIMIGTALALSMAVLSMIVNLFDRNKKDDDEDYEYREI